MHKLIPKAIVTAANLKIAAVTIAFGINLCNLVSSIEQTTHLGCLDRLL
ncbi:hypothetical protein [Chamaesiphon sp. OTE_75_metabat_556]|nr:hypothetical protein [Chamaesiphon sp. OTE_75_metabat_556]